jgi:ankyrin repeat protein
MILLFFEFLLDRGADPNVRLPQNGSTPSHLVTSRFGWIEIARVLIEVGASIEGGDERGRTLLDVASGVQCDEIIKY